MKLGLTMIVVGILGGIALAAFLGGYLMLYCGIVDAVNAFKADPVNTSSAVRGILKAVFCEFGVIAGILFSVGAVAIGVAYMEAKGR
ncbi:MAG: hypothetical protein Q7T57_03320 [Dehalococcoidales bacterium]|nr:hypothetical protein [Dehalococcoidales bacterium]